MSTEARQQTDPRQAVHRLLSGFLAGCPCIVRSTSDTISGPSHSASPILRATSWPSWSISNVVSTPGSGFGAAGEGYVRLSAFNSRENVREALNRIAQKLH